MAGKETATRKDIIASVKTLNVLSRYQLKILVSEIFKLNKLDAKLFIYAMRITHTRESLRNLLDNYNKLNDVM
jgi:hypothetical protein